ncbi:class I SAM-dependent methyltransferase [Glycomyces xiaoerkulensis]|uniref:class I SAM-dependent methyltransferase n=1 Tax=Glycomyces xiaoerkulensis TaxID=2038139 RepID=UPI0012FFD5EF|nr:class I SAM-dependent methyltransferase [Glycomyces xiaoerkulensis]
MNHRHPGHHGAFEGRSAKRYRFLAHRLLRGLYRRIARDLSASAEPDARVLDVGTGPGVLLAELARARPDLRLTGIDLSADMVAEAGRDLGGRATVLTADVGALPFGEGSFDVVVSSYSSHHWDDPAAGAAEIARVLRPGGRLLVYDFDRAPFDELGGPAGLEAVGRSRFRTGWIPMRSRRFEAVRSGD